MIDKTIYTYKFEQELNYSILFSDAFCDDKADFCNVTKEAFKDAERIIIIFDQNIHQLYGKSMIENLKKLNNEVVVSTVSSSEELKNIDTLMTILERFEHFGISRRSDPVIAIGGGSLLDLVGMACSLYRRGIPYFKVPTTLLSMVDACLGAKTGINHFERRNRLGTYYPAEASFIDEGFLKTLPKRFIAEGTGEILKMGVIKDEKILDALLLHGKEIYENNYICSTGEVVIKLSILDMMDSLKDNLWEKNLKRDVDFGHTFGPNIEMHSLLAGEESLSHGEAVALDVLLSCYIALGRNYITQQELDKVVTIMNLFKIRSKHPLFGEFNVVLEGFLDVQKHRNNCQHLPVPRPLGTTFYIEDLSHDELRSACRNMMAVL